jgi:hypothetical protein
VAENDWCLSIASQGAILKITFIEAIKILRADYEQVSRRAVRRIAQATKRRPVHPHVVHAIGIVAMNKPLRYRVKKKRKRYRSEN